jgi:phosphatidylglycerol:prolipoprotein diacylglycerol transferase
VLPEIDLGPVTLQSFGLMLGLAFLASGFLAQRFLVELGHPADWAYEMVFAALVGGLVGARAWSIVEHWDEAKDDLLGSTFSGTGLVFYGGAIGGALAVALWAWRRGVLGPRMFDVAAPSLAVGYAVGRIGCQLAGDGDYGKAWDGPWAMAYPNGTVPTTEEVHPTPVYETLTMGLVAWFLWRRRHSMRPGALFALYLVLAGAERFLVEFVRRNDRVVAGLTVPQLIAAAIFLVGAVWLVRMRSAGGVPAPARS